MRRIRDSFMLEFKLGRALTCVLLYFICQTSWSSERRY
jgi:hypothetical protein